MHRKSTQNFQQEQIRLSEENDKKTITSEKEEVIYNLIEKVHQHNKQLYMNLPYL